MDEICILIVDDEVMERTGLRFLIKKIDRPIRILEAENGEQALRIIRENQVDILLTDIRMPLIDGLELTRLVRKTKSDISIAICSAYGEFAYAREAMRYGVQTYMLKPLAPNQFFLDIRLLLDEVDEKREKEEHDRNENLQEGLWNLVHRGIVTDEIRPFIFAKGMTEDRFLTVVGVLSFDKPFFNIEAHSEEMDEILKSIECALWVIDETSAAFAALVSSAGNAKERIVSSISDKIHDIFRESVSIKAEIAEAPLEAKSILEMLKENSAKQEYDGDFIDNSILLSKIENMQNEIIETINRGEIKKATEDMLSTIYALKTMQGKPDAYIRQCMAETIRKLLIRSSFGSDIVKEAVERIWKCSTYSSLGSTAEKYAILVTCGECQQVKTDGATALVKKAIQFIQNHYNEELSLESIAQSVYLTPNYLGLIFKRQTGKTPIRYLMDYRLERVAWLLTYTDQKITDIMTETGHNNPSYLSSIFRSKYGCSPSQYRRTKKENDDEKEKNSPV